ncbi:probable helicase senataxin isoform X2 [Teleopsis dalmanni]|uniref:probable helicase senataxin isoform X2 n=1 Tax=Teleopsis dalmanni TaxID=139649 RepID=UPI0018CEC357|nr:probable helicase senataxin isoform X2 [Teleopsis dalmanni]
MTTDTNKNIFEFETNNVSSQNIFTGGRSKCLVRPSRFKDVGRISINGKKIERSIFTYSYAYNLRKDQSVHNNVFKFSAKPDSIKAEILKSLTEIPNKLYNVKMSNYLRKQKANNEYMEIQKILEQVSGQNSSLTVEEVSFAEEINLTTIDATLNGAVVNMNTKYDDTLVPYVSRTENMHQKFPRQQENNAAISHILNWGDLWVQNQNFQTYKRSENLIPMPNNFLNFEQYKSIIIQLMKMEFMDTIQQKFKADEHIVFSVEKERISIESNRLIIITKYEFKTEHEYNRCKYDLVLLSFGKGFPYTFAYASTNWKGTDCCTLIFEIFGGKTLKSQLLNVIRIQVLPISDHIRVEMGAINAIYQMENSPFLEEILNPLKLTEREAENYKVFNYKGYEKIDEYQWHALFSIYAKIVKNRRGISLIQGPPGTGKTRVITNLVLQCLYGEETRSLNKKILICAPSNNAVDLLASRFINIRNCMDIKLAFKLIRFGVFERIDSYVQGYSIYNFVEKAKEKHITEMTPEQEFQVTQAYIKDANIVFSTLASCVKLFQYIQNFDISIVDEATQCTEPLSLMPLQFGISQLILVGDVHQLPATVKSGYAATLGYGRSIFTRIENCIQSSNDKGHVMYMLRKQYRMHPDICLFPNQYFYNNKLINANSTNSHLTLISPYCVLNLNYPQNENCFYGQIRNDLEIDFIANLIVALNGLLPHKLYSYGIITPYAEHRNALLAAIQVMNVMSLLYQMHVQLE